MARINIYVPDKLLPLVREIQKQAPPTLSQLFASLVLAYHPKLKEKKNA